MPSQHETAGDEASELTSENEAERAGNDVRIIEFGLEDDQNLADVVDLHMELLDYGPMAGLGPRFIRDVGYLACIWPKTRSALPYAVWEVSLQDSSRTLHNRSAFTVSRLARTDSEFPGSSCCLLSKIRWARSSLSL